MQLFLYLKASGREELNFVEPLVPVWTRPRRDEYRTTVYRRSAHNRSR
jgi:hypothetical protein